MKKLTCRQGAQRNAGQVKRLIRPEPYAPKRNFSYHLSPLKSELSAKIKAGHAMVNLGELSPLHLAHLVPLQP